MTRLILALALSLPSVAEGTPPPRPTQAPPAEHGWFPRYHNSELSEWTLKKCSSIVLNPGMAQGVPKGCKISALQDSMVLRVEDFNNIASQVLTLKSEFQSCTSKLGLSEKRASVYKTHVRDCRVTAASLKELVTTSESECDRVVESLNEQLTRQVEISDNLSDNFKLTVFLSGLGGVVLTSAFYYILGG